MGKRNPVSFINCILWAVLTAALPNNLLAAPCYDHSLSIKGDWGHVQLSVDVAEDPEERARGLMFVESMPQFSGMVFLFDPPTRASFWMRNTLIPLDMIFIDSQGQILGVHENAQPGDETPVSPYNDVAMVVEINGGLSNVLGLNLGGMIEEFEKRDPDVIICDG